MFCTVLVFRDIYPLASYGRAAGWAEATSLLVPSTTAGANVVLITHLQLGLANGAQAHLRPFASPEDGDKVEGEPSVEAIYDRVPRCITVWTEEHGMGVEDGLEFWRGLLLPPLPRPHTA